MVYTTLANISGVAGTPTRFASSRTPATWVNVQALADNTGDVYLGGADPASKQAGAVSASGKRGMLLMAGASYMFPPSDVPTPYDLHELWFDVGTSGDKISITYLVR